MLGSAFLSIHQQIQLCSIFPLNGQRCGDFMVAGDKQVDLAAVREGKTDPGLLLLFYLLSNEEMLLFQLQSRESGTYRAGKFRIFTISQRQKIN